jgi:hypothetical protein
MEENLPTECDMCGKLFVKEGSDNLVQSYCEYCIEEIPAA